MTADDEAASSATSNPDEFAFAIIKGIVGSGLPEHSAAKIADRLVEAFRTGVTGPKLNSILMNVGKVASAQEVWRSRDEMVQQYRAAEDKVRFLCRIKGIGRLTAERLTAALR